MMRFAAAGLIAAVLIGVTGCGSLQDHEDVVRAAGGGAGPTSAGQLEVGQGDGSAPLDTSASGIPAADPGAVAGLLPANGASSSGDSPGAGAASAGTVGRPGAATPGPGRPGAVTSTAGNGSPGAGGVEAGDTSAIVIGNVGNYSGVSGGAQIPGLRALQAFVAYVNGHGGVAGRQIKLYVRDDQSNPALNASATQQLVEQSKVVAFVANWASQTQQASSQYLHGKGIPVIGGDHTGADSWGKYDNFFPNGPVTDGFIQTNVVAARNAISKDQTRLGLLVCAEAPNICAKGQGIVSSYAPQVGFDLVYNAQASFVAGQYTAQCLQMKSSGVQVLYLIQPASAVRSVARDCAQQGFKPIYVLANGGTAGDFNKDPNFDGSVVVSPTYPFSGGSNPEYSRFKAAMESAHGKDVLLDIASSMGWGAAITFEEAVQKVIGPVTSKSLTTALWTFKNASPKGWTTPLTFKKDAAAMPPKCAWVMRIADGKYVTSGGGKVSCF